MTSGLDLNALPDRPGQWKRIVACLNVWNDVDELQRTVPTWKDYVDHVVVVDGQYHCEGKSTDGTVEYLTDVLGTKMEYLDREPFGWRNQQEKRNVYFEVTESGDILFVVDADETVKGARKLREVPDLDVGWVHVSSPLYRRPQHQPRLFRGSRWSLQYHGRHHWVHSDQGRLVCTHQQGAPGYDHRLIDISIHNSRGQYRKPERKRAISAARTAQDTAELQIGPKVTAHEPLRILHVGPFDAGNVVHRLHTAINTTTPHRSDMAVGHEPHPCEPPKQHDILSDSVPRLVREADILHHHVLWMGDRVLKAPVRQKPMVMHHHGTEYRRDPERWNKEDADRNALRLVSNVELLQYGENLHFLPNPVPVAQYRALAKSKPAWNGKVLRVAHSPTKPEIKGTQVFTDVCEKLRKGGIHVEPVLIHGKTLRESLEIKATCHAVFDSFDLGMQCSGLEGAAMGLPVIAGDHECRGQFSALFDRCPYTFVFDGDHLEEALRLLATNEEWYAKESAWVSGFVVRYHDYGAVTERYLSLLDAHFGWREALGLSVDLVLPMRPMVTA